MLAGAVSFFFYLVSPTHKCQSQNTLHASLSLFIQINFHRIFKDFLKTDQLNKTRKKIGYKLANINKQA